jgi:diguanylate cyclase (GGDEF)-like protein/PAS domain S-box-containing protein
LSLNQQQSEHPADTSNKEKMTVVQSHFERIAATSPDIIFVYDLVERRNVYCNGRVADVLGYSADEFQLAYIQQKGILIHPDDEANFSQWLAQVLESESDHVFQIEHRVRHSDGSWRWLKLRAATFLRDDNGKVLQIVGTGSDMTEHVLTHASLKEQTDILQLILNSMTEGVMVCDTKGELILVNQSAMQMLKLDDPVSNLSQLKSAHTVAMDSGAAVQTWHQHPLVRSLRGERVADYELSLFDRKRGLSITLNHAAAPLLDGEGQIKGAVDVFRDVTDSRRAIQELQHTEQHFRLLVDGTTDFAIFMLNNEGFIVSWNPGAEHILGYTKNEVVGRHISLFFTPEDQQKGEPVRKLKQTVAEGRSEEDSWRVRKDGQRFWCTGVMGALHDENGKLQGFVEIMRDNTERRLAEQNTFFIANHDPLTGLANRARFLERLHEALINADRDNARVGVLLLDLDRFKSINDSLGHHAGDQLLKQVAQRLSKCVRETDTVARLGGDEFVLILTRLKSLAAAELLAANIIKEVNRPYLIEGHNIISGASLGIALYPQDGKESGELLQKADMAMYRAKSTGRNRYRIFAPGMLTEVQLRQQQEEQLRLAVQQGDFELAYQPQIDTHSLDLIGVEALLRCRNPQLMMLSPRKIIALAEDIGVIIELGEWILNEACKQVKKWQDMNLPFFKVAVNFAPAQLLAENFIAYVERTLHETQLAAQYLEIEVTESALVAASESKSQVMHQIKALGVSISVDDFGTGVSTLSYLKDYPIDVLKLDATLIRNLPQDKEDVAIVSAIIKLAIDLQIKVIAEGVENVEQLGYLRTTPCHMLQGFLFSEAVRSDKFEMLLQNRKREGQIFH